MRMINNTMRGATVALGWVGLVRGHSHLVMEKTFSMATTSCEDLSCRKEIYGANETMGVGAASHCSQRITYWDGAIEEAPTDGKEKLFDLLYSCRKVPSATGEATLTSFEECGMVAEPCLDAATNPNTSEVTYQIAFEFETDAEARVDYDVVVDVELYFHYLETDEPFYDLRSEGAAYCALNETCHRKCDPGERGFTVELADGFGDGWNAGGINAFDHFRLDSHSELMAEVIVAMDATSSSSSSSGEAAAAAAAAATTATVRRTSYKNTMLGGSSRTVPLCLADGEYFFSTEFHNPPKASEPGGTFSIGGRLYAESSWSFCGATGVLADYTYVRIVDGVCAATAGWGETAPPASTPTQVGATNMPTPAPLSGEDDLVRSTSIDADDDDGKGEGGGNDDDNDDDDNDDDDNDDDDNEGEGWVNVDDDVDGDGDGDGEGEEGTLTDSEILGIGLGALAIAALAAAGGTFAQHKGWFAAAAVAGGAGGAAAAAGAAGGGGSSPDEFAP